MNNQKSETFTVLDNLRRMRTIGHFEEMDSYMMEVAKGDYSARTKFGMLVGTHPCRHHLNLENRKALRPYIIASLLKETDQAEKLVSKYIPLD